MVTHALRGYRARRALMHIAVVVGFILAALAVFYFSGALSVLVLLVLVALLIVTGGSSAMPSRRCIFVYNLVVACILAALIELYFKNSTLHNLIPAPLQGMPVYSLWFGALGGLVISFKGVYEHAVGAPPAGWDNKFNLWHLGRPISGAITGGMTYVLLWALNPSGTLTEPVVYAAAFILGTQEQRFFTFLYEIARIIIHVPETASTELRLTSVTPQAGPMNTVLMVSGQGIAQGATVTLRHPMWQLTLPNVQVNNNGTALAGLVPTGGQIGTTADIEVINPNGATAVLRN